MQDRGNAHAGGNGDPQTHVASGNPLGPLGDQDSIIKEGYLFKKGHLLTSWKYRYFVLTRRTLSYYEDKWKREIKGTRKSKGAG